MFRMSIKPKYVDLEYLMDQLIKNPVVVITNTKRNTKVMQLLGMYGQELRQKKLLSKSYDRRLKETTLILKCNNFYTPGTIEKKKSANHTTDYIFNTVGIPKVALLEIPEF